MFLFSRTATPKGHPRDVMAYATDITDYVNSTVDTTTTLWQGLFGGPVGTLTWNTLVRSRAQYGEVMSSLMAEDGFHEKLADGLQFASDLVPTHDELSRFVFGNPDESPPGIGAIAEMVRATARAGRIGDAMEWGPEVAQMVGRIGGTMPSFWSSAYGTVGDISWITIYPSLEALDEAQARLQASEEYLTEVDKGVELFIEGSGQRGSAVRLR